MSKYKLGEIAKIQSGPFGTQLHKDEYVEFGIPMLNSKNIGNGDILVDSLDFVPQTVCERLPRYVLEEGDILFGRAGTIERHAYVTKKYDGAFQGTNCIRIRCKDKNKALYISYYLWKNELKQKIENMAGGSIQSYITTDLLKDIEVEIPSGYERIASLLAIIDKKIENNSAINDNLQHQLKLLYDYWFTQFDFPDEYGKPYRSSGGQMVWNPELKREIPANWSVKSLAEILTKNTEAFDYKSKQPAIDLSVMPADSIALEDLNTSDNFNTNLYVMHQGDILFGSIRPYLHKAGFAPCDGVVAGTVHSYRVKKQSDYDFALFTLCRNSFFDYAVNVSAGTKMPVISSDSLLAYKIAYNPEIANRFNSLSVVDTIAKNIQESQRLIALRDWLLPMLMNGQATVQD